MSHTRTGAELFVDTLEEYGVSKVFGNPGTTELPVLNAIAESGLEYVLGLHEDIAVGMASGYAQTRRYHSHHDDDVLPVGVANLHITPGLAHGLGNVYAAKSVGAPLVVTAGNHELDFRHEEPLLTGELEAMVEQFCKFTAEVTDVEALPLLMRRAFRIALTPPTGPVFLALPFDVMQAETDRSPERLGAIPNAGGGDPRQLAAAADALVAADDPVIVLGDEVARAGAVEDAVAFAEAVGARVHGEILACEVNFPTDHDQWVSFIPPAESLARMLMGGDTVVFVGCSSNTTLLRHEDPLVPASTFTVDVSNDPMEVGKHQSADVAVLADPGLALRDLAGRVEERLDESVRAARLEKTASIKSSLASTIDGMAVDEAPEDETRAGKHELVDAMRAVAPDAFIVDEGITAKYPLLLRWSLDAEGLISNKGGGLGYGLPASLGAAFAEREREHEGGDARQVVGYIGDGSYLYYPHSLYTAARHDLDLTVVIPDNRNYRILKDNTTHVFGGSDEDYDFVGMDFDPPVDIVKNAESHGARGTLVETADGIEGAFEAALSRSGPDVLDVLVHD